MTDLEIVQAEDPTAPGDDPAEAEDSPELGAGEIPGAAPQVPDEAEPAPVGPGPGEDLTDEELLQRTAALLFASPDPLRLPRLVELLERPTKARVQAAIEALGARFEASGLPYVVVPIAGGWRIMTAPEQAEVVQRLAKVRKVEKVTPAALETLAIVAYRQPVTNAEVEAIRGVQSGAMLRSLVDRGLIRVTGRADQPGAPLQYGTTREFLDQFGLQSLKDLPRDGELAEER